MSVPDPSRLDANQVLQAVYDEATGRLRTDAEATIVNAELDISLDSTEDNVAIASPDGDFLSINTDGSINTVQLNSLVNFKFDSIYPTYPSSTVEIYTYKQSSIIVGVITVTYVDSTKNEITSIVRL